MSTENATFSDLLTRAGTGVLLAAGGLGAVVAGGWVFLAVVALVMAVLVWEMARLTVQIDHLIPFAAVSGLLFLAVFLVPGNLTVGFLALPSLWVLLLGRAGAGLRQMAIAAGSLLAVMLAGYVAVILRDGGGVIWLLWLVLTVVITDICGYFAGRAIGGAKFWPSISPKKTWAGVIAGWLGAGVIGAIFMPLTNTGEGLILVSIFLSFASQMGDIAESALKRRAGVKDSSNLLPGHGGLLDRLDGVIGALLVTGIVAALTNYPEAPI